VASPVEEIPMKPLPGRRHGPEDDFAPRWYAVPIGIVAAVLALAALFQWLDPGPASSLSETQVEPPPAFEAPAGA
jgi:hypothetical protein